MQFELLTDGFGYNTVIRQKSDGVWEPYLPNVGSAPKAARLIKILNEDEERRVAELIPGATE